MDDALNMRYLEVRSWPERADIVVVDRANGEAMAHYDLMDVPTELAQSPLFDVNASWQDRAKHALHELETDDQELLRIHFGLDEDAPLHLAVDPEPRERLAQVLQDHGLSLADVEFSNTIQLIERLERMSVHDLWALMSDWYDVCARRYPAGISRREPESWVHRAHPDRSEHYSHISRGNRETAWALFKDQVDLPLANFSLYELICWVYFSRTEFADHEPFGLQALSALSSVA